MEQTKNPVKLDAEGAEAPVGTRAAAPDAGNGGDPSPEGVGSAADVEERIVQALKTIYDPEIPVNIYELGLIYDIEVGAADEAGEHAVRVKMTLTSPACPVAGSLPGEVEQKVASVGGVERAEVELVWDPTWNPSMMSEAARLELGFF